MFLLEPPQLWYMILLVVGSTVIMNPAVQPNKPTMPVWAPESFYIESTSKDRNATLRLL